MKDILVIALAAVALLFSGVSLMRPATVERVVTEGTETFAAAAGPEHSVHQFFNEAATIGGHRSTSTDDTTATFLANDLRNVSLITFTPNVTGITATLPASSTLQSFVPKVGDTRVVTLCNGTSTATTAFTLASGTGVNLHQATSTLAIISGECAQMTFTRAADRDIELFYDLGY